MAERSWYDIFRRRIAPIAFLVAIVALGTRTCRAESTTVELSLGFGDDAAEVRAVRVDVFRKDDGGHVAYLRRTFGHSGAPGPLRQELQLDPGLYRLDAVLETTDGARPVERVIDVQSGVGGIRVDLGDGVRDP